MKNRGKLNYIIDIVIGFGFIVSALSGLVLLLAGNSGGFQGGRNLSYSRDLLLFSRIIWKNIHNWSSLIMIAGVSGHLVLHWNWLVCMTRKIFMRKHAFKQAAACVI